jgi:hypothetical protein
MTRKERIVKAMKRDAEIHARGHYNATERNEIAVKVGEMIVLPTPNPSWFMQIVAEIIEAPAK